MLTSPFRCNILTSLGVSTDIQYTSLDKAWSHERCILQVVVVSTGKVPPNAHCKQAVECEWVCVRIATRSAEVVFVPGQHYVANMREREREREVVQYW